MRFWREAGFAPSRLPAVVTYAISHATPVEWKKRINESVVWTSHSFVRSLKMYLMNEKKGSGMSSALNIIWQFKFQLRSCDLCYWKNRYFVPPPHLQILTQGLWEDVTFNKIFENKVTAVMKISRQKNPGFLL